MPTVAYLLTLLAIVTVAKSELVCPGFGFIRPEEPCVNDCSPDKDTCASGTKCCYTPLKPCGYRCLVAKENIPKRGTCPSPDSDQDDSIWLICDANFCDVDGDCPCKEKCCSNKCGSKVCIAPAKKPIKKS